MRRFSIPLLVLLSGLVGCESEKPVEPGIETPRAAISGHVFHRLNPEFPLAGAVLNWSETGDTTDAQGAYRLAELPAGGDSLRVSLTGFLPEVRWVELSGEDRVISFALTPIDIVPPPPPRTFQVNSLAGVYLRLSWTPPLDQSDLAGYWLTKSPGDPQSLALAPDQTSWVDITISPSREYTYSLYSRDSVGNLSSPLVRTAILDQLPTPPDLIALSTSGFDSIPLAWGASEDADFAAFRLFRSADSQTDSTDLLIFESTEASANGYVDRDVEANAVFFYRLYVYDQAGQVSTHRLAEAGAAQIFIPYYTNEKRVLPLPGGNRFLYYSIVAPGLRLADGEGSDLDSLDLESTMTRWHLVDGGERAWGIYRFGYLAFVDLTSFQLIRGAEIDYLGDHFAYLGGDSLLLGPLSNGPPVLFDGGSLSPLDTLDLLSDLAGGSIMTADSVSKRVYIAEPGGQLRLIRLDLSGAPVIEEQIVLGGVPADLHYAAGALKVAYRYSTQHEIYDPQDFTQVEIVTRDQEAGDFARFSEDGSQLWQRNLDQSSVCGFDSESGARLASFNQISPPYAPVPLTDGSRVVVPLNEGLLSICDPGRDDE